jgi:hypothetical protein
LPRHTPGLFATLVYSHATLIHPSNRHDFIIALECLFLRLTFERIFAIIKLSKRQRSGWMYHITYVLLHQFRKKTQKTPRREIEKAKAERDDWISRKG